VSVPRNAAIFARLRIVLVVPSGPANIETVRRAVANLGLSDLVVVAPRRDLRAAAAYSAHGCSLPIACGWLATFRRR
jgi:tRNA C32,U32 (ribose-2'-O)-methylase TrmJ